MISTIKYATAKQSLGGVSVCGGGGDAAQVREKRDCRMCTSIQDKAFPFEQMRYKERCAFGGNEKRAEDWCPLIHSKQT